MNEIASNIRVILDSGRLVSFAATSHSIHIEDEPSGITQPDSLRTIFTVCNFPTSTINAILVVRHYNIPDYSTW